MPAADSQKIFSAGLIPDSVNAYMCVWPIEAGRCRMTAGQQARGIPRAFCLSRPHQNSSILRRDRLLLV